MPFCSKMMCCFLPVVLDPPSVCLAQRNTWDKLHAHSGSSGLFKSLAPSSDASLRKQ